MKTRNVNLENTPLLTNNICKYIFLEAPTLSELKKKVKEYEILLVRALTNTYRLSALSLDKNGSYSILPDGNYQAAIFLNFSGTKKDTITNPERTLQYVKHLTAMESKNPGIHIEKSTHKQELRDYYKSIHVPIEMKPEDIEIEVISSKQRQILERLITDTNLIKISFYRENKKQNLDTNITTNFLRIEYHYRDVLEIPEGHSDPDEQGNR